MPLEMDKVESVISVVICFFVPDLEHAREEVHSPKLYARHRALNNPRGPLQQQLIAVPRAKKR